MASAHAFSNLIYFSLVATSFIFISMLLTGLHP
jgi:hypothetical protein